MNVLISVMYEENSKFIEKLKWNSL